MGNSHPKYLTSAEALDIIGTETWENLRSQLGREGNELDFSVFSQIITSYFDKVVSYINTVFILFIDWSYFISLK